MMKVAPTAIETKVRRLAWLQQMLGYRQANSQMLAALFGQCRFEQHPTVGADHRLTPTANSLARRAVSDIDALYTFSDGQEFAEELDGRIGLLLCPGDDYFREKFRALDVRQLKLAVVSSAVPPPGFLEQEVEDLGEEYIDEELPFHCGWEIEEENDPNCGMTCDRMFGTLKALFAHRRFEHSYRNVLYPPTVTNQCFVCMSTFASQQVAQKHVSKAFRTGRCVCDMSVHAKVQFSDEDAECLVCGEEFVELSILQRHIRTMHLPNDFRMPDIVMGN